jgi:hypothetical protein
VNARSDIAWFAEATETLVRAEEHVNLLGRVAPADVLAEAARLARDYSRGSAFVVTRIAAGPDFSSVRRTLVGLAHACEPFGAYGRLYAERALELELEARLAEALGKPEFRALAAERFPEPPGALSRTCDAFVVEAERLLPKEPVSLHLSDDAGDPQSLVARLRLRARELGLAFVVRTTRNQLAVAATGNGVVSVRAGVRLSATASERIAAHELLGHALPRARARFSTLPLLRAGTRRAGDDEEGRALVVERRAGLFDAERQRELALRHLAALGVRRGAEPRDTTAMLVEHGAPLERAIELTLRIHRGGGLAREIVYLPAYFAVRSAFAEEPSLERWFERGRIGLEAARELNRALPELEHDRTASAGAAAQRRWPPV